MRDAREAQANKQEAYITSVQTFPVNAHLLHSQHTEQKDDPRMG